MRGKLTRKQKSAINKRAWAEANRRTRAEFEEARSELLPPLPPSPTSPRSPYARTRTRGTID